MGEFVWKFQDKLKSIANFSMEIGMYLHRNFIDSVQELLDVVESCCFNL